MPSLVVTSTGSSVERRWAVRKGCPMSRFVGTVTWITRSLSSVISQSAAGSRD
jgi:hypothetical protein